MYKKLIHPERLRKTPVNFSWIDHRLVRQGYLVPVRKAPNLVLGGLIFEHIF